MSLILFTKKTETITTPQIYLLIGKKQEFFTETDPIEVFLIELLSFFYY